jgi:FixJ family two-component response regulator
VFASAEDFLSAGHLQDTACLVVDVRMPEMSGLELQRLLVTAHSAIPIIFITCHDDAEARAPVARIGYARGQWSAGTRGRESRTPA